MAGFGSPWLCLGWDPVHPEPNGVRSPKTMVLTPFGVTFGPPGSLLGFWGHFWLVPIGLVDPLVNAWLRN